MIDNTSRSDLLALLAWYRDMGADNVLAADPVDWLSRGDAAPGAGFDMRAARGLPSAADATAPLTAAPPAPRMGPPGTAPAPPSAMPAPAPSAPNRRFPAAAPDAAETTARTAARAATTIAELAHAISTFDGCGLKATAKSTCVYRGGPTSRLMIIGEAPGRDEDLEGKPFVGRAGQLLDRMLTAIGLGEGDVHITNIVYWRPPGNRTPTPQEAQVCRPFLERQVELVGPDIVVLLGGAAAKHLLETAEGIMRVRGKWRQITLGQHQARAIATLHPAYLLRTPAAKRLAWHDLLAIKSALDAAR